MLCAIDVGHIGKPNRILDKGAQYKKVNEADLALLYAMITRGLLECSGINTVFMCHTSYTERHTFCKKAKVDLHLQCHLNAAKGRYALVGYRAEESERCLPLAKLVAREFEEWLPVSKTTLLAMETEDKRRICTMAGIPSLLIEPLFLDNDEHWDYLIDGNGVENIADALTRAIVKWKDDG